MTDQYRRYTVIYYQCAMAKRKTNHIAWRNPQPINHEHLVLDCLICIHAGQLQNCFNWLEGHVLLFED